MVSENQLQSQVTKMVSENQLQSQVTKMVSENQLQSQVTKMVSENQLQSQVTKMVWENQLLRNNSAARQTFQLWGPGSTSLLFISPGLCNEAEWEWGLKWGALLSFMKNFPQWEIRVAFCPTGKATHSRILLPCLIRTPRKGLSFFMQTGSSSITEITAILQTYCDRPSSTQPPYLFQDRRNCCIKAAPLFLR